jgi:hypothetical protein
MVRKPAGIFHYIPKFSLIDDELANFKLRNEILRDFRSMDTYISWRLEG